MKCVVSGSTGFIGRHLVSALQSAGHEVAKHSRGADTFYWDRFDAMVHLAGEPVAQRWSTEAKRKIRDSRVQGTRRVVDAMAKMPQRPSALVCASAIGYYGSRGDELLTEESAPGWGFLSEVCIEWEQQADRARELGIRVVKMRIGVALGADGGALAKMLPAFRMFVGGMLGSGRQWMSWIHIEDLVGMFLYVLQHPVSGVWNGTSPNPVTNAVFTEELGKALHRPAFLRVPPVALRAMFGEMGDVMLEGQRVDPSAARTLGFQWKYPELASALRDIISRSRT